MITNSSFDRRLAEWLDADAQGRVREHLTEVLVITRATRQRPAWSSLERWLPMDIPLRLRMVPATPWLTLLLLALVAAAMLGIVLVGSQRHGLLPYGPARNGPLVYERDGDLHLFDPALGSDRLLVSGSTDDYQPRFSPDGTRMAYLRETDEGISVVGADAAGVNPRVLAGPFPEVDSMSWAGDSRRLAVVQGPMGQRTLIVIDVEGGTVRHLDLGAIQPASVSWLPPDGAEIVVHGRRGHTAVWAIRPDGSGLRLLTPEDGLLDGGYAAPIVSPDGRRLAYASWDDGVILRTTIRDLVDDRVVVLPDLSPTSHLGPVAWSPDSSWILVAVNTLDGPAPSSGSSQLYLFPSDAAGAGRPIGPELPFEPDAIRIAATFSPDGRFVYIVHGEDHLLWTVPVAGGSWTTVAFPGTNIGSVQRLLP